MKIIIDCECNEPEEFKAALLILNSFQYPSTYAKKTIEELTNSIFFKSIDLEATYDEFAKFSQINFKRTGGIKDD